MYQKKRNEDIRCPLEYGVNLLAGKWKSRIICLLGNVRPMRYGELKANLLTISDGVLSSTLNQLIRMEMVRKSEDQPGLAEYRLTEKALSLIPLLQGLCQWSGSYYNGKNDVVMTHCLNCEFYRQWENGTVEKTASAVPEREEEDTR